MVALTALAATATSNGPVSPDVDQTGAWRTLTRWLPVGVRRHRGLTHWWGLPLLAWLAIPALPVEARWVGAAMVVGWVSHLAGDAVFGRVPVAPWGGPMVGLGLDTGGFVETGRLRIRGREVTVLPFGPVRLALAAALAWVLVGAAG